MKKNNPKPVAISLNAAILILWSVFLLTCQNLAAADIVGRIDFVRGAVTGQVTGEGLRILGKDNDLFEGDVITVASLSVVVLELNDGSKISLRPESVLKINSYSDISSEENISIHLYKGGLRIISGRISKINPEAFKVTTSVSTIGISGTELDARLCQQDCVTEANEIEVAEGSVPKSGVVGRVAFMRGELTAIDVEGTIRQMARGGPVLNNEEYRTGVNSNALLVFRDGGRISMKEDSVFRVENYEFDEETPEEGGSSLQLIQGGLRALTGTISDANPDAYKVNTSVATIGIRGTGFDLVWLGACSGAASNCGLVASVWLGGIFSENDAGTQDINLNQTARVPDLNQLPEFISTPPAFIIPRPDLVDVDMEELFAALTGRDAEPGLFVACYQGHCSLEDDEGVVDLGNGESGFAGYQGGEQARVTRIEPFQQQDRYLRAINTSYDTLFEIQDDRMYVLTEFQCVIR